MTAPAPATNHVREFVKSLKTHAGLWIVPAAALTLSAALYAQFRPLCWEATQGLLIRDEAVGSVGKPGRFESPDARKTAQETALEIARNYAVVAAALAKLPPPPDRNLPGPWPSEIEVRRAQETIRVSAPKGTEFGRTDVVYLSAQRPQRQEAIRLAAALGDELETRLKELRNARAASIIAELSKTVSLAKADLEVATKELGDLEGQVGSDLGELRILNESGAGESNLRSALNKIKDELRQVRSAQSGKQELRNILAAALRDPTQLVATPSQLLESQPALRRLKDGLVDAQLHTSQILGKMSDAHPLARAAVEAEQKIRENLQQELQVAVRGVEADIQVSRSQLASLETQLADVQRRLGRLAELRARYGNLVAEVKQRSQTLEEGNRAIAEARANQGASQSASLLTRFDAPTTGDRPLGPGGPAIVASGLLGGLGLGIALVLLINPLRTYGRRWSDYLPGRRSSDHLRGGCPASAVAVAPGGRRGGDLSAPRRTEETPPGRRAGEQPVVAAAADGVPAGERRGSSGRRCNDRG